MFHCCFGVNTCRPHSDCSVVTQGQPGQCIDLWLEWLEKARVLRPISGLWSSGTASVGTRVPRAVEVPAPWLSAPWARAGMLLAALRVCRLAEGKEFGSCWQAGFSMQMEIKKEQRDLFAKICPLLFRYDILHAL